MRKELQNLIDLYQKHKVELDILPELRDDLIPVKLKAGRHEWLIYVEDEYEDMDPAKPLLCFFLVLHNMEVYEECVDFLQWSAANGLSASDAFWLNYYRDLAGIYKEIEQQFGKVDSMITGLEYQLRSGAFYELYNYKYQ